MLATVWPILLALAVFAVFGFTQVRDDSTAVRGFFALSLGVALVAVVFTSDWWHKLSPEAAAAWVQAFGSILAIIGAAGIAFYQNHQLVERERDQARRQELAVRTAVKNSCDVLVPDVADLLDVCNDIDELIVDVSLESIVTVMARMKRLVDSFSERARRYELQLCNLSECDQKAHASIERHLHLLADCFDDFRKVVADTDGEPSEYGKRMLSFEARNIRAEIESIAIAMLPFTDELFRKFRSDAAGDNRT